MRIYLPNDTILHALRGTRIAVVLDAPDVRSLASNDATNASSSAAQAWVQANVRPYYPDVNIKYIAVGNEVKDGADKAKILPAMNNIRDALSAAGLGGHIKVESYGERCEHVAEEDGHDRRRFPRGYVDYLYLFDCVFGVERRVLGYGVMAAWLVVLFYLLGDTAAVYFCSSLKDLSWLLRLSRRSPA
ncbi:hypothetical protein OsI_12521 [Oryza sativa Indica Group]|uniref:Glucan endo-1,3-beta-D-glucosidase n=1 Tax=Oryza sativa subsp. indica TaxID=39946 RepID=B8AM49_ORYSI|nr:hypothetical protein OsI_12521 [Oryza sativa Indica Group]